MIKSISNMKREKNFYLILGIFTIIFSLAISLVLVKAETQTTNSDEWVSWDEWTDWSEQTSAPTTQASEDTNFWDSWDSFLNWIGIGNEEPTTQASDKVDCVKEYGSNFKCYYYSDWIKKGSPEPYYIGCDPDDGQTGYCAPIIPIADPVIRENCEEEYGSNFKCYTYQQWINEGRLRPMYYSDCYPGIEKYGYCAPIPTKSPSKRIDCQQKFGSDSTRFDCYDKQEWENAGSPQPIHIVEDCEDSNQKIGTYCAPKVFADEKTSCYNTYGPNFECYTKEEWESAGRIQPIHIVEDCGDFDTPRGYTICAPMSDCVRDHGSNYKCYDSDQLNAVGWPEPSYEAGCYTESGKFGMCAPIK